MWYCKGSVSGCGICKRLGLRGVRQNSEHLNLCITIYTSWRGIKTHMQKQLVYFYLRCSFIIYSCSPSLIWLTSWFKRESEAGEESLSLWWWGNLLWQSYSMGERNLRSLGLRPHQTKTPFSSRHWNSLQMHNICHLSPHPVINSNSVCGGICACYRKSPCFF